MASDPTISRLISALDADADTALSAIGRARATARSHAWTAAGPAAPDRDIDEHHPLCAFVDNGTDGTGETVAMLLRPGNSGSNTASDPPQACVQGGAPLTVVQDALAQLPSDSAYRVGKKVLVRIARCRRHPPTDRVSDQAHTLVLGRIRVDLHPRGSDRSGS
ncbi:hypothetical protein EV641_103260 [Rhodococcus sp. SMB37]|nr:hypothetical protein EV641_103260 [Rhodococcus sp. SMB37]